MCKSRFAEYALRPQGTVDLLAKSIGDIPHRRKCVIAGRFDEIWDHVGNDVITGVEKLDRCSDSLNDASAVRARNDTRYNRASRTSLHMYVSVR